MGNYRAAETINIAPRLTYVFNQAINTTESIYLGPQVIPSFAVNQGVLIPRMSAGSSIVAGAQLQFDVVQASVSPEEPNVLYYGTSLTGGGVRASNADTWPKYYPAPLSTAPGGHLAVVVSLIMGATAGQVTAIFGIDLVLRSR